MSDDPLPLLSFTGVTLARAGKELLGGVTLSVFEGDRVHLEGENGAGKSSLLLLMAGRLHPHNNTGTRAYAWDAPPAVDFRQARKNIALISRDEDERLKKIHHKSTVREFLLGHLDGQDFLYREVEAFDVPKVRAALSIFSLEYLENRLVRTLSLGEMRLCTLARMVLHERRLYLFDEVLNSLAPEAVQKVVAFIQNLIAPSAVVFAEHDRERTEAMGYNRVWRVAEGRVVAMEKQGLAVRRPATDLGLFRHPPHCTSQNTLVEIQNADFYHDFTLIFKDLNFTLREGDRWLVTGPNGSGKTTLLRILHGDFYPVWGKGHLHFKGALQHEEKSTLWARIAYVSAQHFTYYPPEMTVRDVFASRYSMSIYDYAVELPKESNAIIESFQLVDFLPRRFNTLSEGEKTRVLFARAFLLPAPLYLIDEGFLALSEKMFALVLSHLTKIPSQSALVVASHERLAAFNTQAKVALQPLPEFTNVRLTSHEADNGRV
ncbi:MAG: putative HMP/thiamine import ATP-binding protein YkoD [Turneriella sp.]|nr:putative HMP/thiamine import ATP-binding protein YkoD [Turneriella sp.]